MAYLGDDVIMISCLCVAVRTNIDAVAVDSALKVWCHDF